MALLDLERNVVVIRVVYDGPPEAGKTTSLRALGGSLGQEVFSPAEDDGRTLYFDWMDYTAGRFEGYQIRCQIVSVPGQRELAARRRHILAEADVVIFVAEATERRLGESLGYLDDLPGALAQADGPPLGVILQANKRDLPDSVPVPELRARLEAAGHRLGVMESIAAEGAGIRETFVFAVRLALDRVRELLRAGRLGSGRPEIDDGRALLASMQSAEAPALLSAVLAENHELEAFLPWQAAVADGDERPPRVPDPSAPSGAIWPPVEGRMILHEACSGPLSVHRLRGGSWAAGIGSGWRAHSAGSAVFPDVDHGRACLIQWARLHAACAPLLSARRCIVLIDAGDGGWRLWQVLRAERSLRDGLAGLARLAPEEAAARLTQAAAILLEMDARLQAAPCQVPCTLDTVGQVDGQGAYIALVPPPGATPTVTLGRGPDAVAAELTPVLADLYDRRGDVLAALERAQRRTSPTRAGELVKETFGRLAP